MSTKPNYNGTETGRMSCAAPETQELPGTPGRTIQRRARTPLPEEFVHPDYAKIEQSVIEAQEEEA